MGESEPVSAARREARARLAAALGVAEDGWIECAGQPRRWPRCEPPRPVWVAAAFGAMVLMAWWFGVILSLAACGAVLAVGYVALLNLALTAAVSSVPPPEAYPPHRAEAVRADACGLSLLAGGHWRRFAWSQADCRRRANGVLLCVGGYVALLTQADGALFRRAVAAARRLSPELLASTEDTPDTALSRVRLDGAPEVARGLSVAEGEEP